MGAEVDTTATPAKDPDRWFWRRVVALASFVVLVGVLVGALLVDVPQGNVAVITTAEVVLGSVLLAYFGGSALEDRLTMSMRGRSGSYRSYDGYDGGGRYGPYSR